MDLIVEKIPEKFIDASNILASFCKKYNFIYEVNKLKKKNSEILIDYLLKAFSILISGERIDGYYYYKRFLIKNIINSVNNIQNINFDKNLDESDIFIDKSYSIKLLNYSFSNEKMKNLITKISDKYCEGKNDILFLEILKENITNEYVFNYLFDSLSEAQIKEIFQNNKESIIKAIYGYTEINKLDFIQKLLNNLKISFPDDKFINNLIFPSDIEEEFNEMVNILKNEKIIYKYIEETGEFENEEDEEKENEENKEKETEENKEKEKVNEENKEKVSEDMKKYYKYFFLFNYSLSNNVSKNDEVRAMLYNYSSSFIPKLNFCKEIYFSLKQIIAARKIPNISSYEKAKHYEDNVDYRDYRNYRDYRDYRNYRNYRNYRYERYKRYYKFYERYQKIKSKLKPKYENNYVMRLLNFIQETKNEAKIKELNPSYHELIKLTELVNKSILAPLDTINNLESTIYLFYIIIFIFHKTPFKLKNMICKLELDNYSSFKFSDLIKKDILEDDSILSELELFIILSLLEIKGDTIISIKEYLPKFYSKIEEKYKEFREFKIPEMNCRQPDDEAFIEGFKYILNNNPDILITNLLRTFNFYSFIFILELKSNTLDNDANKEFYLEKTIYKLINFSKIMKNDENDEDDESGLKIIAENTLTLQDFTTKCLSFISQKDDKEFELAIGNCNYYLLNITYICNFILKKYSDESPYNLSVFNLKIFNEKPDKLGELKNKILIQKIKDEILTRFDNLQMDHKEYYLQLFDAYVRNWLDDYLKTEHIINEFSNIEKEKSSFIKYIKYLKVNCLILNNYLCKIDFFIRNIKRKYERFIYFEEIYVKPSFNEKIKFTLIKEKDKEKARQDLEDSMYNYGIIITNYILKFCWSIDNNIDIKISYYFNDEINDYVETCTNQKLSYFINSKISKCDSFFFQNEERTFVERKEELTEIIKQLRDHQKIDSIIKLFFTFFGDIYVDNNNEEFFEKYKFAISSYCKLTATNILEPQLENFLNWIKMQFYEFFYQNLYPIISFNYRLFLYHYNIRLLYFKSNYNSDLDTSIIVNSLNQKGIYIPKSFTSNKNLMKFVYEVNESKFNFEYINFLDLTGIFKSIRNTRFHEDDNLNSLFQVRAINYILNGDSLLNIFISDLFQKKNYSDNKIIVFEEERVNENLNTSRMSFSSNNDINNNNNNSSFQKIKLKGKKLKLKLDSKKILFKNNSKEQNDLNEEKNGNNKNNKININYYEKMMAYKFDGKPTSGYFGHIPYKDNFYGKRLEEVLDIIINNNLYLKYDEPKNIKKLEEIIICNDEKPLNSNSNIKKHHKNYFKTNLNETIYEKRRKEKRHFKPQNDIIKTILKFDYFGNYSNNNIKFGKRHKKSNNEEYPNIFDALFSIRNIGKPIGITQHDISKLLSPYNNKDKFELLMNHAFPNKTRNDIPENWKVFLKNPYEENKNQDDIKDVGIIKLHKGY